MVDPKTVKVLGQRKSKGWVFPVGLSILSAPVSLFALIARPVRRCDQNVDD